MRHAREAYSCYIASKRRVAYYIKTSYLVIIVPNFAYLPVVSCWYTVVWDELTQR